METPTAYFAGPKHYPTCTAEEVETKITSASEEADTHCSFTSDTEMEMTWSRQGQRCRFRVTRPSHVVNESSERLGRRLAPSDVDEFDQRWCSELVLHFQQRDRVAGGNRNIEDLYQALSTGSSNGHPLYMQTLTIPARQILKVHAHPNIEFELTLVGDLWEFRTDVCVPAESLAGENPRGPHLPVADVDQKMAFFEQSVPTGSFLANEVGSIHQSFTAEEGTAVLLLWSGCHANIAPEDIAPELTPPLRTPQNNFV